MLRPDRSAASTLLAAVILVAALTAPQPSADAAEPCAPGWTDVGDGICELVVTENGAVALPSGRVFDVLVVGAGGGGGGAGGDGGDATNTRGRAGGGGGGAVVLCTAQTLPGPLTVTLGTGGVGSPGDPSAVDGGDGEDTLVLNGDDERCAAAGGKGGRAGGSNRPFGEDPWGDGGASGDERSGGQSQWTKCSDPCDWYTSAGGGGAGAGASGVNASAGRGGGGGAGAGGDGTGLFTGDTRLFGGGGGGGSSRPDLDVPPGGAGGGGAGARALSSSSFDAAVAGTANTGGGGGGGSSGSNFRSGGAAGGTGVVILRYDLAVLSDGGGDGGDGGDGGGGGGDGGDGGGGDGGDGGDGDDDGDGDDGDDGEETGSVQDTTGADVAPVPARVNTGGGPLPIVPLPLALGLLVASVGVLLVQRHRELVWVEAWLVRQRQLRALSVLHLPAFDLLQTRLDHLRRSLTTSLSPAAAPATMPVVAHQPAAEVQADRFDALAQRLETFRREQLG